MEPSQLTKNICSKPPRPEQSMLAIFVKDTKLSYYMSHISSSVIKSFLIIVQEFFMQLDLRIKQKDVTMANPLLPTRNEVGAPSPFTWITTNLEWYIPLFRVVMRVDAIWQMIWRNIDIQHSWSYKYMYKDMVKILTTW